MYTPQQQCLSPGVSQENCTAGLSVIQLARSSYDNHEYALQLFASRAAFEAEAVVYKDKSSPFQRFLPKLQAIFSNEAGGFQDPWGNTMPPCIIMEKGEPLNVWSHRQMTYKTLAYVVRSAHHTVTWFLCTDVSVL